VRLVRWEPMSDDRRPVWPWIAALLVGLPVLYVASFGPACWLVSRQHLTPRQGWTIFRPLVVAAADGPSWIRSDLREYATIFSGSPGPYRQMDFIEERTRRRSVDRPVTR
jgi:hypothetical protein